VVTREGNHFLLEVQQPTGTDYYIVTPIPADYGTAFRVAKQHPTEDRDLAVYHVNIGDMHDPAAVDASCECPGFCYRGKCRHILGIRTLIDSGKLPWPRSRSCLAEAPFIPGRSDEPRFAPQRLRYALDGTESTHPDDAA